MLGIVGPGGWLIFTFVTGCFGEFIRQMSRMLHGKAPNSRHSSRQRYLVLSVAMITFCADRWRREFRGLGKGASTLLISMGL